MIADAGGYEMPNTERIGLYFFGGSGTLADDYAITADLSNSLTTAKPNKVVVWYQGQWELDGNSISVFDTKLTQKQALAGNTLFMCIYDGAAWKVTSQDLFVEKNNRGLTSREYTAVLGALVMNLDVNLDLMNQEITGHDDLGGDITVEYNPLAVPAPTVPGEGDAFIINYKARLNPNGHTVTIYGEVLTDAEVKSGNTTVFAWWDADNEVFVTQKVSALDDAYGQAEIITMQTSFEADEVGDVVFNVPFSCQLVKVQTCVNKTIADTDPGALNVFANAVNVATINVPISSAVGTVSSTVIGPGAVLQANDPLKITSSKPTAGGRVQCFLSVIRYKIYS